MAADNKLELIIQVDAAKGNAAIQSVNKNLTGLEKGAVSSTKQASKGFDGMMLSMTKAVVAGNAIYDVAKKAFAALKDFTLGAIQTQDEMGKTLRSANAVLEDIADRFQTMPDRATKTALSLTSRSWQARNSSLKETRVG